MLVLEPAWSNISRRLVLATVALHVTLTRIQPLPPLVLAATHSGSEGFTLDSIACLPLLAVAAASSELTRGGLP
jgi:hypothetical protein